MEHWTGIAEVWVRVPIRPEFSASFVLAKVINLENVSIRSSYEISLIKTRRKINQKQLLKWCICHSNDFLSWNSYTISSLFSANEVILFTNCSFSLFVCLLARLFIFYFFFFSFLFCVFSFVRFWKILVPSIPDPSATNQLPECYCGFLKWSRKEARSNIQDLCTYDLCDSVTEPKTGTERSYGRLKRASNHWPASNLGVRFANSGLFCEHPPQLS